MSLYKTSNREIYAPFYLLWVFLILPKEFCIFLYFALYVFLFGLGNKKGYIGDISEKTKRIIIPLILASAIYIISIVYNILLNFDSTRLLAALNTFAIWVMGILFFWFYASIDMSGKLDLLNIARAMFINVIILICLSILYITIDRDLPISMMIETRHLARVDYLDSGTGLRFNGYLEYPTAVTVLYIIIFPLSAFYVLKRYGVFKFIFFSAASFIPVWASSSRAGMILGMILIISTVIWGLYTETSIFQYKYYIGALFSILLVMTIMIFGDRALESLTGILSSRSDSTAGRLYLYKSSMEMTLQQSPIIGIGVKYTSLLSNDAPFGSHSTWIGMFYKTGVLGTFFYLIAFISIIVLIRKKESSDALAKLILISCLIFYADLFVEDIDGAAWILITWLSVQGAFLNSSALLLRKENKHDDI